MKIISNEPVLMAVCILIYDKFLLLSDDKKMIFIKELKYKMSIDLDKKDLYKKFNYNHKRFRKADFQGELIENKKLNNEHFYRYLGDYFDINVIIYENSPNYINNYNSNRYSVILQKSNDNYYIHYNLDSLSIVNDSYIKSINNIDTFNRNSGTLDKDLTKNKLGELQNIAKGLNINTMKHGRCNLINKTKKELIYEITKIDR